MTREIRLLISRFGLKKDIQWARFFARWMLYGFFLHLIAAVCTVGFYSPSEHLNVLELVQFKLSKGPATDLPTEFHRMLLPWLLPAFFTLQAKVFHALGLSDPFQFVLWLRFESALFGCIATGLLGLACYQVDPSAELATSSTGTAHSPLVCAGSSCEALA